MLPRIGSLLLLLVGSSHGWVSQSCQSCGRATKMPLTALRKLREKDHSILDVFDQQPWVTSLQRTIKTSAVATLFLLFPPNFPSHHLPQLTQPAVAASTFVVSSSSDETSGEAVVEEVWGLVNKYSIDRKFGGQDWNRVRQKYIAEVKEAKQDEGKILRLVTEMVASLGDKYSRILDPSAYSAIQKYDLIGVGVTLMPDDDKQIIVGAPPIPGSEAARVGLQVGDKITAINGVSNKGRTAFDIIEQIGDDPNAETVTMSVTGADGATNDLVMKRQFQEVKDPIQFKLSERRRDGTNVGYIRVSEFNFLVMSKLEAALDELKNQGANAYVLDLRHNAGGAFQSAVEISGLFMKDRVATYVVDSTRNKLPFRTPSDKLAVDASVPIVIWIDGKSASATEVLAGALHDNCRAILMGNTSFGKGLIQAVYGLKNGAGLVLTVARYVTPSGTDIQGVGISPDVGSQAVPLYLPGVASDTTKVDFQEARNRLDANLCKAP